MKVKEEEGKHLFLEFFFGWKREARNRRILYEMGKRRKFILKGLDGGEDDVSGGAHC